MSAGPWPETGNASGPRAAGTAYEYGPYAVLDISTNTIAAYGCTLDDLEAEL